MNESRHPGRALSEIWLPSRSASGLLFSTHCRRRSLCQLAAFRAPSTASAESVLAGKVLHVKGTHSGVRQRHRLREMRLRWRQLPTGGVPLHGWPPAAALRGGDEHEPTEGACTPWPPLPLHSTGKRAFARVDEVTAAPCLAATLDERAGCINLTHALPPPCTPGQDIMVGDECAAHRHNLEVQYPVTNGACCAVREQQVCARL